MAIRAQMAVGTLNNYIAGRDMKASAMIALARACGVPLEWLAVGAETPMSDAFRQRPGRTASLQDVPAFAPDLMFHPQFGDRETIQVKYFDAEPSPGAGMQPNDWEDGRTYTVSRHFIGNVLGAWSRNLFFVRIQGDSMQPSIDAGDTLLVNYTPAPFVQSVYVVAVQGLLMVKRLSIKDPETLSVVSDNPRYASFDVPIRRMTWSADDDSAQLRLIGRVIGRFHLNV
ncbi:LexA family transcriptional regulator [Nguyenibacter vanlangensis]|uniref:LexA family transcriptional regulator n=1 Tax=Nguyenibacter vanlangensis TaxID=1216886 RepID=A0ABZ3D3Z7_9PROT